MFGTTMGRPFGVEARRPGDLLHVRRSLQILAGDAIEHVEEAVAVGLQQELARLPLPLRVHQHERLLRVVVVHVVRRELEVPLALPGLGVERHHRIRVEVVAQPFVANHVGTGIAHRPVEDAESRVVAAGHPRARAGMVDGVALPRLRPRLAALRHGPEAPHLFPGGLVVAPPRSRGCRRRRRRCPRSRGCPRSSARRWRCSSASSRPSRFPRAARRSRGSGR